MEYDFSKIHEAHRRILREMTRVCEKNGIHCFLDSGTLLGAVRHKDSIPWDDDADCTMLREDYEKFRKIAKTELGEDFLFFESIDLGNEAMYDFIPRVALKTSLVQAEDAEMDYYGHGMMNHVLVDIFVIDDCHDSAFLHKIVNLRRTFWYGLSMGHRYQLDFSEYHGFTKFVVKLLSSIGRHISVERIVRKYEKIAKSGTGKNKKKYQCFSSNTIFPEFSIVYQKEWWKQAVPMQFNTDKFMAPVGYDGILRCLYGEYMKLPPKDKQVPGGHCHPEEVKIW